MYVLLQSINKVLCIYPHRQNTWVRKKWSNHPCRACFWWAVHVRAPSCCSAKTFQLLVNNNKNTQFTNIRALIWTAITIVQVAGLLGRNPRSNNYHIVLKRATRRTPPEAHTERRQEIFTVCSPSRLPRVPARDKLCYRYANKKHSRHSQPFLPPNRQTTQAMGTNSLPQIYPKSDNFYTYTVRTFLTHTWTYTDELCSQVTFIQNMRSVETY